MAKKIFLLIILLNSIHMLSQVKKEYYENGTIKSIKSYDLKGDYNGIYETYSEEGLPIVTGTYNRKEEEIGTWKTYLKDRSYYIIEYDKNGVIQSNMAYTKDHKIAWEKPYLNGKREGTWNVYSSNGNVTTTENYKNGKLHGIRKEFDTEEGTILLVSENYVNGDKVGECAYYHKDGKKKEIHNYVGDDVYKEEYIYYDNGNLKEILSTKNEFPDGVSKSFYPNGNLESTVDAKGFNFIIKKYAEDGELIETIKM